MFPRRSITLATAAALALGLGIAPAAAQEVCVPVDSSTDEVLPGVTLTWDSSFPCEDAPDQGTYHITVTVSNDGSSVEGVTIDDLDLSHTTPRPRGQGPDATAVAEGLPLTLASGASGSFTVSGSYELVETDEGMKANLHLRTSGFGVSSGEPFQMGINVQLRGADATEDGDDGGEAASGPPEEAGNAGTLGSLGQEASVEAVFVQSESLDAGAEVQITPGGGGTVRVLLPLGWLWGIAIV